MKTEENSLQLGESPENKIPGLPYSLADFEKGMTELSRLVKQEVALKSLSKEIEKRLDGNPFWCNFPIASVQSFLSDRRGEQDAELYTVVGFVLYALDKLETK